MMPYVQQCQSTSKDDEFCKSAEKSDVWIVFKNQSALGLWHLDCMEVDYAYKAENSPLTNFKR